MLMLTRNSTTAAGPPHPSSREGGREREREGEHTDGEGGMKEDEEVNLEDDDLI